MAKRGKHRLCLCKLTYFLIPHNVDIDCFRFRFVLVSWKEISHNRQTCPVGLRGKTGLWWCTIIRFNPHVFSSWPRKPPIKLPVIAHYHQGLGATIIWFYGKTIKQSSRVFVFKKPFFNHLVLIMWVVEDNIVGQGALWLLTVVELCRAALDSNGVSRCWLWMSLAHQTIDMIWFGRHLQWRSR